jgi:DNA-binding LacI/PurR family transcriptional regulator
VAAKTSSAGTFSTPPPEPLRRKSLITQATDAIREHIHQGTWTEKLPGERHLCEILMISRPTLRHALDQLEKEGMISVAPGKHRLIKSGPARSKSRQRSIQEVIILSPEVPSQMKPSTLYLIDEIYKALQKTGYRLSIQSPPWLKYKKPDVHLARHIKEHPSACWALFSTSEAVQRWFSNNRASAIVSGSCFPSVNLPSIDLDNRAIAKHAVGTFLRKGFTKILLLAPEKLRPGSSASVTAFHEAIKASTYPGTEGRVLRATSRRETLIRQINEQLQSGSRLGIYALQSLDGLYLISYFLRTKVKLGTDVGLICFGNEYFFEHLVVKPTCYVINKERFATKFCQMLLQLAQTRSLPPKALQQMPDFQVGDTL